MSVSYQTITTAAPGNSYTIKASDNYVLQSDPCATWRAVSTKINFPQTLGPIHPDMPLVTFKYKNDLIGICKDNKCYIFNTDEDECFLSQCHEYEPLPEGHIFLINEVILGLTSLNSGTPIVHKATGKIYFFFTKTKEGNAILFDTDTATQQVIGVTSLCNDYFQVINLKTTAMERNFIRLGQNDFLLPLLDNDQLARYKASNSYSARYLYIDYLYKREHNVKKESKLI